MIEEEVILLSDQPISAEVDDKFQRYQFSKRIAETIASRTDSESLAVGIYGAWGEGKTSILNFIRQELKPYSEDIVVFSFNPWRFTDEAALLTTFFNTLASELKNSIPNQDQNERSHRCFPRLRKRISDVWNKNRSPLKTKTETIGEIIERYGKIVSILGAGETAVAIGKAISNVDIEVLKKRIESLLKQYKKRIVIFIDDIDRLDRNEIHAIFRLVKLTGDFTYTTYVLSFDENMVSASIGDRFGSGDTKAGLNFLEKIIQLPIKIPLAQKAALKNYCFNLVEQALNSSNIQLSNEEAGRFVHKFTSHILNRLNTPRLAIRYCNTLSFSLPLLKGEVNTVDLMLIESMKVFYPEIYDAVRTQPDYFIGSYKDQILHSTDTKKGEAYKQLIENLCSNYSEEDKANVKSILNDLFPNQQTVWGGNWIVGGEDQRYREKKISSTQYFNRYFSYTVIEGDVSDVAFDALIEFIKVRDINEAIEQTHSLIRSATPDNFIEKFRFKEKTFDSPTAINVVKVISSLGEYFPVSGNSILIFASPLGQAAIFVSQLIRNQIEESKKIEITQWIIDNAKPFKFVYQTFDFLKGDKDEKNKIFTDEEYTKFAWQIIQRAIKDAGDQPVWEKFTNESKFILTVWSTDFDKSDLNEYVNNHLTSNVKSIFWLLRVFSPFIQSSIQPEPFYGDFGTEAYTWIKRTLNVDFLYEKAIEILGISPNTSLDYIMMEHRQTDDNRLKQFVYLYNQDKNGTQEE